ncbi:MAG: methyltransferase [Mediterranea sp.]|jgi:tRNA1Val (adenine37-N6)-methyltransferase|nr:methyltransferase [Mediterranea sp.]
MSNPYFRFKQFAIRQDRCAMKVGTDGVLLGAWAQADAPRRIMDIGTGTGLVALMLAQRYADAQVTAMEIDSPAARQAAENVAQSPWNDRVEVVCGDFRNYSIDGCFDLLVSNPPYFVDALACPDRQRHIARHADTLSYESLFRRAVKLLAADGRVAVIIPADARATADGIAIAQGLHPAQCMQVVTKPGKAVRRVLLSYSMQPAVCTEATLCIESAEGGFSKEYIALTGDFYLNF